MLPDAVATVRASLSAGQERHVLTTDAIVSADGELISYTIYPSRIRIAERLTYERADELIAGEAGSDIAAMLRRMHELAGRLRERRRTAGALLIQRREPKIKVSADGEIEISIIDNSSPSRELVAELMVLCNHAAAKYAAERRIPLVAATWPVRGRICRSILNFTQVSGFPFMPRPARRSGAIWISCCNGN
jgi:exoribonuclease II